ncbi:MAG: hypothetical protein ACREEV_00820, partial [Dongiaceae bacterium]
MLSSQSHAVINVGPPIPVPAAVHASVQFSMGSKDRNWRRWTPPTRLASQVLLDRDRDLGAA